VALLTEDDHQHNFEVWMDSLILSVNESGLECVLAAYERAMPGIRPILEAEVARAKAKEKEKEKDGESE
jgi:hypothetical protein